MHYLILWPLLAIACEALIELWLTAGPLEWFRCQVGKSLLLSKLFFCPYCLSFWVAIPLAFLLPPLFSDPYVSYFINLILIHRLSNIMHKLYEH